MVLMPHNLHAKKCGICGKFALYLHLSFFFALKKFLNIYLYMAFTIFAIYLHLTI